MIELIVVLGIIALLFGLLLPAVQSAREAARHAQCTANLKQLGIALHDYNSVHGMFPPLWPPAPNRMWSVNFVSGFVFLLPHLEQVALFNSINMPVATLNERPDMPRVCDRTARNARLSVLLCPSDGEPNHLNSYRFNGGRYVGSASWNLFDGPFGHLAHPSEATVTDGLAQTAFVSERVGGSFSRSGNDPRRDIKSESPMTPVDSEAKYISLCLANEPGDWSRIAGRYWFFSGYANTEYNHRGSPNDQRPTCIWGNPFVGQTGGLSPPRSFHPGGVNVLFGDGHTSFVKDSIARQTWIALGTYKSGDIP